MIIVPGGAIDLDGTGADNYVATFTGPTTIGGEANLTFDSSTLTVTGDADITGDLTLSAGADGALRFSVASSIKILDNSATSLVFEEADNAYMTFVTTNSSESVNFGVDDLGRDVKFFGATSGAYMLWDESADQLLIEGPAEVLNLRDESGTGASAFVYMSFSGSNDARGGYFGLASASDQDMYIASDNGSIKMESDVIIQGATPTLTIGDSGAEDAMLIFDGNAEEWYMGVDYSATDAFVIGTNSTMGSEPRLRMQDSGVHYFSTVFTGAYTSSGSSTIVVGLAYEMDLTAVAGDTGYHSHVLLGANAGATITTQNNSETITRIETLHLDEPNITKGNDTVTNASTLYIQRAPTEATNNYSMWVDAGTSRFDGTVDFQGSELDLASGFTIDPAGQLNMTLNGALVITGGFTRIGTGSAFSIAGGSDDLGVEADFEVLGRSILVGNVFINDTANGFMDTGLTIKQGADEDNEAFALKAADVGHPMTALAELDTYFTASKSHPDAGGAFLVGYRSNAGVAGDAMFIRGILGEAADTTTSDNTSVTAVVKVDAKITDGSDSATAVHADGNIFLVSNGNVPALIIKGDGELFSNETATVGTFDSYDDAQLIRTLDHARQSPTMIRERWDDFIKYNEQDLVDAGILGDTRENGGMLNVTGLQRLHNGAIWQGYTRQMELQEEVTELKSRLLALEGA